MNTYRNLLKSSFIPILFCILTITSCSNNNNSKNETGFVGLYNLISENHHTYKDIAPIELPDSIL